MLRLLISILIFIPFLANAQVAQQRQDQISNQRQNTVITFAGRKEVASRAFAYAPSIISKCSGSLAGGAQGQFAGISFAGSYKDEFCERAELIKLCIAMGQFELADQLLYEFPMIKNLSGKEVKKTCRYPTETNCEKR